MTAQAGAGSLSSFAEVTVVTAAYSIDRWDLTCGTIESTLEQQPLPREIIIPVDHNPALLARLRDRWEHPGGDATPRIRVVASRYDGHLGASATTAAELAETPVLIFLDDDAAAEPGWLLRMVDPLQDPNVLAVGGAPVPRYESTRPAWLPHEFNWVFGCAYEGLPKAAAPILHLIGTTMSVRRADVIAMGGIHSDNHPDMEMCHRLLALHPEGRLIYDPAAVVQHYVPAARTTWRYFWRRVFLVNRSKVWAVREMGAAGHLNAERGFVTRVAPRGVLHGLRDTLRGDPAGLLRAGVVLVGLALAAAGYAIGRIDLVTRDITRRPAPKTGWRTSHRDVADDAGVVAPPTQGAGGAGPR